VWFLTRFTAEYRPENSYPFRQIVTAIIRAKTELPIFGPHFVIVAVPIIVAHRAG
jgi:hypothetical protein